MLGRGGWCRVSAAWMITVPLRRTLMRDHGCRPGCVHAARRISGGRVPGPPRASRAAATVDPLRPAQLSIPRRRSVRRRGRTSEPHRPTGPRGHTGQRPPTGRTHAGADRCPPSTRDVTGGYTGPGCAAPFSGTPLAVGLVSTWNRLGIDLTRPADRTTRRGDRIIDDTGTGDQLLLQVNFRQAAPGDDRRTGSPTCRPHQYATPGAYGRTHGDCRRPATEYGFP